MSARASPSSSHASRAAGLHELTSMGGMRRCWRRRSACSRRPVARSRARTRSWGSSGFSAARAAMSSSSSARREGALLRSVCARRISSSLCSRARIAFSQARLPGVAAVMRSSMRVRVASREFSLLRVCAGQRGPGWARHIGEWVLPPTGWSLSLSTRVVSGGGRPNAERG